MDQLAVTVIGPDRPGIIADVTGALAGVGGSLEDSSMTLLRGHFAMTLICTGPCAGAARGRPPPPPPRRGGPARPGAGAPPAPPPPAPVGPPYFLSVHGADLP